MQKPAVVAPVVGVKTVAQLEDNLGACGWALSDAQMSALDAASAPHVPYPWEMVSRLQGGRRRA